MNMKYLPGPIFLVGFLIFCCVNLYAENIDPYDVNSQYAYGENIGWLNFEPSEGDGVQVSSIDVQGYLWAENIGWINLSPVSYGGVVNDGSGNLSGYAWGENVGWINFSPDYGGVTIDTDGNFDGWAWGENIGWINFNSADLYGYNVKVCMVNYYDFARFAALWLETGPGLPADLYEDNIVDFLDLKLFVDEWLDYCPDGWPLK